MPPRARLHVSVLLTFTAAAASLALSAAGCGGGQPPPPAPPAPSAAASTAPAVGATGAPATTSTAVASVVPPPPPPVPTSAVAAIKPMAGWAACHQSYAAKNKDVVKDVAAMAEGCKAMTKMQPAGKPIAGKQGAEDAPQSYPLEARGGHCYRVYAQASDGIQDLDVAVKDSAGVIVGQDSTDDPSPVVTEDGEVCFSKDDRASVVVSVGMGKGNYAVQVWGD